MEKKIEILNIFDFDGTMFRSPVPSPELWDSKLMAKIKDMPANNGYGWFQDVVTLSEPAVPKNPGMEWWNDIIVKKVGESIENPSARTSLLTGRTEVFMDQIKSFAQAAGLKFDDYGLAPAERSMSTMQFKQSFIRKLISSYNPKEINIYDDRPKQSAQFETFFKKEYPQIKTNVVYVKAVETILKPNIEIEVVNILKQKYRPDVTWISSCSYTGVRLNSESKGLLKAYFPPIQGWKPYYEHMTICLGALSKSQLNLPEGTIGTEVELTITHHGKSEESFAVRVTGMQSINKLPHITCCVHPTSKPMSSNYIQDWIEVQEELVLTGVVEEFGKLIKEVGGTPNGKSPNGNFKGKGGSNNNSPQQRKGGKKNDPTSPIKLDQGKMIAKGHLINKFVKVSGADMKDAIAVLEDWLEKEGLEYTPQNLPKIEEFMKNNWSS